ncbi:monovalent cation/H+ antiporter subunit D [Xylophilus sp. Leaf220]|uniref:monovalent cation/H+ antiporter subunit D n=1 Tax=Xylophilus sp. Leaf220 TaxID=1735686 RepID=UPI0006FABE05|nr:monovalent cation/H+ antiporter subunit D [Xylophilus sp. Leaf220]KQM79963.1 cation:proton antiporter [Xylophilus sp. Leaf220]
MSRWIEALMPHVLLAPILLPMLTGALMLLAGEERRRLKLGVNLASTFLWLVVAVGLLRWVDHHGSVGTVGVYLPGNWPAPFGIVLAIDRLSALMLVLAGMVALASILFASSRWHRAGVHFHPLFQFQLMGLAGAFLTADLFNLFVFFEIMLAASYGLLLHGSGRSRVQASLHYIAINLAASSLFLIGTAILYGVTGTLNMADLAQRIPQVAAADRGLLHAAAAILSVAFLTKAAVWPLNFWLVPAYSAATAPVAGIFAIMSKVGIYTLLRLWSLLFSADAGESAFFGGNWLIAAGMLTLAFGAIGMLASQKLGVLAGYGVLVSSGTLLAAMGFGQGALTAGALYYMVSSTLALSALFLLVDLMERWRNDGATYAPHERADNAPFLTPDLKPLVGINLDEEQAELIGRAIPAAIAFLGLSFMACTLLLAGLPPLSGFLGKVAMLSALLNPLGLDQGITDAAGVPGIANRPGTTQWMLLALVVASGLLTLIAMSRTGIRHFWAAHGRGIPHLRIAEGLPVAALLGACILLTVFGERAMRYTADTAAGLKAPANYISAVMQAKTVPNPKKYDSEPAAGTAPRSGTSPGATP